MGPAAKLLNRIRIVAILDALLLAVLVFAALTDREGWVSVLGPVHGIGFLALLIMAVRGVTERFWGWWFPALVVITLGPPGSLIGDLRIRREVHSAGEQPPVASASGGRRAAGSAASRRPSGPS